MANDTKLGATGEYPEGQLNQDDEGELRMAVGVENDTVILNFGKPVAWLGLPPDSARQLANLMIQHANSIDGK